VKSHLSVFVNALIENPAFDSQTKETLTSKMSTFGSKCVIPEDSFKKILKSGIVENVLSYAKFKETKELAKTDGGKKARVIGVPKLDDANKAGGREASNALLFSQRVTLPKLSQFPDCRSLVATISAFFLCAESF
jgi:DNA topoisomerase II